MKLEIPKTESRIPTGTRYVLSFSAQLNLLRTALTIGTKQQFDSLLNNLELGKYSTENLTALLEILTQANKDYNYGFSNGKYFELGLTITSALNDTKES